MNGAVVEIVVVLGLIAVMLVIAGFRAARRHVGGVGGGAARASTGTSGSGARSPIDRFAVGEPWRHLLSDVQRSRTSFAALVASAAPGPLHDRLLDIGTRLDGAVQECWRIAQHGHRLDRVASDMHIEVTRAELAALTGTSTDATSDARAASMRTRIESYERISSASREAEAKLRLLDARLQESAARGGELALQAGATDELDSLDGEVTAVTDELEALRQALEETGGASGLAAGGAG